MTTLKEYGYYTIPGGDVVVAFPRDCDMFPEDYSGWKAIAYLQLWESLGWFGIDESWNGEVFGYVVMPDGKAYPDVCNGVFHGMNTDSKNPDEWFTVTIDARSTPYQLLEVGLFHEGVQVDPSVIRDWSFMGPKTEVNINPAFTLADLVPYDKDALADLLSWLELDGAQ